LVYWSPASILDMMLPGSSGFVVQDCDLPSRLNPINQLAFTEAPLAADFERWQIAATNHALQSLGRDME
jgi:hypothetical protein